MNKNGGGVDLRDLIETKLLAFAELRENEIDCMHSNGLEKARAETPVVTLVYKDVTYQQTQDDKFRKRVYKELSPSVRRKLGNWDHHFKVAEEKPQPKSTTKTLP